MRAEPATKTAFYSQNNMLADTTIFKYHFSTFMDLAIYHMMTQISNDVNTNLVMC